MIKKLCLMILIGGGSLFANAQGSLQEEVIPPSPTASSLIKFADIPVSYYTGRPQVNIPLASVKSGDLSLDISLSYHSGGIKVSEVPGWVGLGWALNAGGCISRSVRGLPDEIRSSNPVTSLDDLTGNTITTSKFGYWGIGKYVDDVLLGARNEKENQMLLYGATSGNFDLQPDLFSFNFAGKTGQFVIEVDENGNKHVRTIPYQDIIINETVNASDLIMAFTVVDEVGRTYYFNEVESSYTQGVGSPISGHNSSWFLTRIESASGGDYIDFEYKNGYEKYWSFGQTVHNKKGSSIDVPAGVDANYHEKDMESNKVLLSSSTRKVSRIITSSEIVEFGSDIGRKDLNAEALILNDIKLLDKTNNEIKKHYQFNYSYFDSSPRASETDADSYRLKLDNIQEISSEGVALPPHVFRYSTYALPRRNSHNQDFWGYYNGDSNDFWTQVNDAYVTNGHFVPEEADVLMGYGNDPQTLEGANREPASNINILSAGVLNEVTYPTGGKVKFTYEPHNYYSELLKEGYYKETPVTLEYRGLNETNTFEVTLEMSESNCKLDFMTCPSVEKVILKKNSSSWSKDFVSNQGMIESWEGVLDQGTYYLKFEFGSSSEECSENTVLLTYFTKSYVPPAMVKENKIPCGGVRIQRIDNYASEEAIAKSVIFSYAQSDNENFSSGVLVDGVPINSYSISENISYPITFSIPEGPQGIFGRYDYHVRSSSPLNSISFTQGSPIGYKEIEMSTVDNLGQLNGKSKFSYSLFSSNNAQTRYYPFVPSINEGYKQGKLIKEEHWDVDGNKVSQSDYNYQWKSGKYKVVNATKVGMTAYTTNNAYYLDNLSVNEQCDHINFKISPYYTQHDYVCLLSKTDSIFNTNGVVVSTNEFNYHSPSMLNWEKTYNSKAECLTTSYIYPLTAVNTAEESDVTNMMIDRNLLLLPIKIEKVNSESGKVIEGKRIHYKFKESNSETYLVKDSIEIFQNQEYKKEIDYKTYNSFGRINKYLTSNGITVGLIWAYNYQYPVVEIKSSADMSMDQIQLEVNNLTLFGDQDKSHIDQDISNLKSIVENHMGGMGLVNYYTYDPLTGMTSQTDPNGTTTYYEYDNFGRLLRVRDKKNKILKENFYHYKGGQTYSGGLKSFSIDITQPGNGQITPGNLKLDPNQIQEFQVIPNANYQIKNVLVNGVSQGAQNSITLTGDQDYTVSAEMELVKYSVATSAGSGGSISASGQVSHGSTKSVTITPNTGYHLVNVNANRSYTVSGNTYTFSNVTSGVTVSATFAINQYNVTTSAGSGGSISASGQVSHGSTKSVTITPNTGYHLVNVNANRSYTVSGNTYTFSNVTAGVTVSATFAINTYKLTSTRSSGGAITGTSTVNYGSNKTFTITPSSSYHITNVKVDGVSQGAISSYTFSNVKAAHTIHADFVLNTLSLSASSWRFPHGSLLAKTISVNSNTSWFVSESISWLSVSKTSGVGNSSFVLNAQANSSTSVRTGNVTVSVGGITHRITVSQLGKPATLNVSKSSVILDRYGNPRARIDITSNASWSVSATSSWIRRSHSSGSGNGTIYIDASYNGSSNSRIGWVIISTDGKEVLVDVSQAGSGGGGDPGPGGLGGL